MTHDEFISIVKQPELVSAEHVPDLKELIIMYPYFAPARLFHAKALQKSGSVVFGANLKFSSLYSSNRRWLYYYIYPDKKVSVEPYKREKSTMSSGGYFDMINVVESEGGDARQTLSNLAERLKSAREMVIPPSVTEKSTSPVEKTVTENVSQPSQLHPNDTNSPKEVIAEYYLTYPELDYSENNAKKLIREHKYVEAIEILKVLNLNNPKKSVYFADQIRFLEKVIVNSKKTN